MADRHFEPPYGDDDHLDERLKERRRKKRRRRRIRKWLLISGLVLFVLLLLPCMGLGVLVEIHEARVAGTWELDDNPPPEIARKFRGLRIKLSKDLQCTVEAHGQVWNCWWSADTPEVGFDGWINLPMTGEGTTEQFDLVETGDDRLELSNDALGLRFRLKRVK